MTGQITEYSTKCFDEFPITFDGQLLEYAKHILPAVSSARAYGYERLCIFPSYHFLVAVEEQFSKLLELDVSKLAPGVEEDIKLSISVIQARKKILNSDNYMKLRKSICNPDGFCSVSVENIVSAIMVGYRGSFSYFNSSQTTKSYAELLNSAGIKEVIGFELAQE